MAFMDGKWMESGGGAMVAEQRASERPLDAAVTIAQLQRENERLLKRATLVEDQMRSLLVLQGVANTLSAEVELLPLLHRITMAAVRLCAADLCALYLVSEGRDALVVEAVETAQSAADSGAFSALDILELSRETSSSQPSAPQHPRIHIGQGAAGWVAATRELLLIPDVSNDPRFPPAALAPDVAVLGARPRSLLVVPMLYKGGIAGVLEVAQTERWDGFDARSLDFIRTLAAQAAVAVANAQLYQRLRNERDRVIQTQEDERKRLGRELHDGPAQKLAQIAMSLEYAQRLASAEPDKLIPELQSIRETALQTTHEIRNLLFDLRPLVLDAENGGLVAALEHFLERFEKGTAPSMHLDAHYTERASHNIEVTVFAIIQEAVNNVLKHSNAATCSIELREPPGRLVAIIRDDGQGFDVNAMRTGYERRGSWGMVSMAERAALIDARLQVASQPGKGTVVSLDVPR